MSWEWKRSAWTFDPVGLSHTRQTLLNAIEYMLLQTGWIKRGYSISTARYYVRGDRDTVTVVQKKAGTARNIAITKVGANITVSGFTGGTNDGDCAKGWINLSAQPSDTDTVTISDGTVVKTYEFDTGGSVTPGNVQVPIGSSVGRSALNLQAAIRAQELAGSATVRAEWSRWVFDGDGVVQYAGIVLDEVTTTVRLYGFLENSTQTALQIAHLDAQKCIFTPNLTKQQLLTILAGEDGTYWEFGSDGLVNNIGQGAFLSATPVPELNGDVDERLRWNVNGIMMTMVAGNIPWTSDHTYRYVDNAGANKNHTANLRTTCVRGSNGLDTYAGVDNASYWWLIPRDLILSNLNQTVTGATYGHGLFTFGLPKSPRNGRYRLSPMMAMQDAQSTDAYLVANGGAGNNYAATDGTLVMDGRTYLRNIPRLWAVDPTLLPWINVTEPDTGKVIRVIAIDDGGRDDRAGIEWPSDTVTIPASP